MSDYQEVEVLKVEGRTIEIRVTEVAPDMQTIHALLHDEVDDEDRLKVAVFLLFDEKRDDLLSPLFGEEEDEEIELSELTPRDFVANAKLLEHREIGPSSEEGIPLYEATFRIRLVHTGHAELFEAGEVVSAAASIDGDLDDLF